VAKRCENIRNRHARVGVPVLRRPQALEELALTAEAAAQPGTGQAPFALPARTGTPRSLSCPPPARRHADCPDLHGRVLIGVQPMSAQLDDMHRAGLS
jgi:hypothetical protein